jgi:hypothetical protein
MLVIGVIPGISEIVRAIALFLGLGGVLLNIVAHTLFGR